MLVKTEVKQMKEPKDVLNICSAILKSETEIDREKEHVWVLGLDNANKIKYVDLVTLGILNASLVHPREIFRLAIMKGCAGIVVCHNHPSGTCFPSLEDKKITTQILQASKILNIPLLDHVIIVNNETNFYSFSTEGTLI